VLRVISYSIPIPGLKFVGLPFGRCGAFSASALIGLETLTFDLSTSKWSHGLPMSWASLLSIFSLLCPSILDSGSGTEQTERHDHQRFMPRDPMWAGTINDDGEDADDAQRSRSLGRLKLRRKMRHIFRRERPTNFKLGTILSRFHF